LAGVETVLLNLEEVIPLPHDLLELERLLGDLKRRGELAQIQD